MSRLPGRSFSPLAMALFAPLTFAQVTATYSTFGSGCNGTGTGLGAWHIVPAQYATSFGGSDNSIPFTWSPVKYQQVFLGTDLPTAFAMAALALRQNEVGPMAHGVTVDLEIQVGYTTRLPSTMSTTFAANFDSGAPVVVLPRAQVVFPDQRATPPTNPAEFLLTIPWPNPFVWVPTPGLNFLVDVTIYGNSNNNSIWGYPLDAGYGGTARLYGSPATATSGTLESSYGLVMSFVELTNTAVPRLYSTDTPQINNQFRVRLSQAPSSSLALLLLGLSRTSWNSVPLPLDLGANGAPGCSLLAAGHDMAIVLLNSAGAGSLQYSLPNTLYLLNLQFYNQALVLDAAANALGLTTTNGGVGLVGNQ